MPFIWIGVVTVEDFLFTDDKNLSEYPDDDSIDKVSQSC